jgi:hypothetical protein
MGKEATMHKRRRLIRSSLPCRNQNRLTRGKVAHIDAANNKSFGLIRGRTNSLH